MTKQQWRDYVNDGFWDGMIRAHKYHPDYHPENKNKKIKSKIETDPIRILMKKMGYKNASID